MSVIWEVILKGFNRMEKILFCAKTVLQFSFDVSGAIFVFKKCVMLHDWFKVVLGPPVVHRPAIKSKFCSMNHIGYLPSILRFKLTHEPRTAHMTNQEYCQFPLSGMLVHHRIAPALCRR